MVTLTLYLCPPPNRYPDLGILALLAIPLIVARHCANVNAFKNLGSFLSVINQSGEFYQKYVHRQFCLQSLDLKMFLFVPKIQPKLVTLLFVEILMLVLGVCWV